MSCHASIYEVAENSFCPRVSALEEMAALLEFYSVYLPNINAMKLRLGDAFVAKLTPGMLPETAVIRSKAGKDFYVEVSKENGGVYFDRGWPEFVEENGLMSGFFLVFRFDGCSTFDVKIFDYTACEKKYDADDTEEVYQDDTQEAYQDDEDDYGRSDDEEGEDADDEDDYGRSDDEEGEDGNDDGDIGFIVISDSEMSYADSSYESYESSSSRRRDTTGSRKRKDVSSTSAAGSSRGSGASQKRAYHRSECVDSDAELLVEPENPYFIFGRGFGKRENQLAVPSITLRDFNVGLDDKILYQDPIGREYVGRVSRWQTGQVWIGGWKSFCMKNRLTAKDKCVCELMLGGKRKCSTMRVHIIRNGFK